ncbi:DUF4785 domain-containing protein [Legionella waltersii]|uniref:DUF4785 domain-containing protein n=1 Tax=Legionella waltersii TaxID=66969 RepID=A0A0W1ANT0_9GAMM|nr:DUF4785 domain-containing protein [Legionella waltersii]KTD83003.1 hypothetical protein Lwal_0119 [Legionella waltersii]SNV07572.1 Uncharacterised protein [Legionella waltersii]
MKILNLFWIAGFCISQAQAFTLPRQPTKSYECNHCSQLSRDNLQDKWEINTQSLNNDLSNAQKSYGYKELVNIEQFKKGIEVYTQSPGAVIRITPLQNKTIPQLLIKTPSNDTMSIKEASSLYSQDQELGDLIAANKHHTMLQIKPELGAGRFIIKTKEISPDNAQGYVISVLDKFSLTYLQVETDSIHYQYGDKVTATISLVNDVTVYDIDEVSARIVGPQNQSIPLKIRKVKPNVFEAQGLLNSESNDRGENWYLETDVESDNGQEIIRRSGHTAFSYSIPSASLISVKKLSSKPLTFVATIDVATASRYSLQSVLFQKTPKSSIRPIQTSQKAQWFEPGKHVIQFTFDNSHQLLDDNLYLGYLRLIDYGQLKTVYQFNPPIKLTQLVD